MAFTCDFVRHDCAHDELFRNNYQRTNRTKGSKILRCFPHCCPDHVTRSFCGAPLYLDVHWRARRPLDYVNNSNTSNTSNNPQASDDDVPMLLVFGRFRLQQEPGFTVGERLAPDAIARSVQSDENPNAQWIKSALVLRPASMDNASREPWRFEINSSARWFYGWESGVAKSHRLREHVLEVLVTTPEPPHGNSIERLRVVATAQSPPFKMISFRRATPEALTLLSASSAPTETPTDEALADLLHLANEDLDPHHRAAPGMLLKIAAHVALWLWWDDALHAQWYRLVDDAAAVLLNGRALRRRFENRVVVWLWEKVDAFLMRTDWTLAALVAAIAHDRASADFPTDVDPSTAAYEAFVAHVRERFVDQQRVAAALQRTNKRRRLVHRGMPLETQVPAGRASSVFDGEWLATLSDLHIEAPPPSQGHGSAMPWRLVHLLWFWREFSALGIRFDASSATLRVSSRVGHHSDDPDTNDSGQDEVDPPASVFVLDHRCRWVRHLPSGASTLAVPLAGYHVGDYVGKVSPSRHEIHLNCYAWPAPGPEDEGGSLWASCFQVHLRAVSTDALQVRVTVNHGRLDPRPLGLDHRRHASATAVARELHSRPLHQKLAMVLQWCPSGEWLWEYARVAM